MGDDITLVQGLILVLPGLWLCLFAVWLAARCYRAGRCAFNGCCLRNGQQHRPLPEQELAFPPVADGRPVEGPPTEARSAEESTNASAAEV